VTHSVRRRIENLVEPAGDLVSGDDADVVFVETDKPHRRLGPRLEHAGDGDRSVLPPINEPIDSPFPMTSRPPPKTPGDSVYVSYLARPPCTVKDGDWRDLHAQKQPTAAADPNPP
jgi:hypothetical protein